MSSPASTRHALGRTLVALQFSLLGALAWWALPALRATPVPPLPVLLALASAALGLWALAANRPGNFNIHPAPREGGQLVQAGPYRWVRHPMYSSVLLFGAACALAHGSLGALLAWLALAIVLLAKARLEERWLTQMHTGYAAYCRRTRRFVPGVV